MIKVVIERRLKEGARIFNLLREGRAAAMKHPGYITGETLLDTEDTSHILVISSWQSLRDWDDFRKSDVRVNIDKRLEPFLAGPPQFHTYRYLSYEQAIRETKAGEK